MASLPAIPDDLRDAYLARLGLTLGDIERGTLAGLALLLARHVDRIAYENIDLACGRDCQPLTLGRRPGAAPAPPGRGSACTDTGAHTNTQRPAHEPPSIAPLDAVHRIAVRGRGGYCFLLVPAFATLLKAVGFEDVALYRSLVGDTLAPAPAPVSVDRNPGAGARPGSPAPTAESQQWIPMPNHMLAVVTLEDERWVVDVGLGDGPPVPFRLPNDGDHALLPMTYEQDGFKHSLSATPDVVGRFRWHHDPIGSFPGIEIDANPTNAVTVDELDSVFGPKHRWYYTDPESCYIKSGPLLLRRTATEVIKLRGRAVYRQHPSIKADGGMELLAVAATEASWFAMVEEHFGLKLLCDLTVSEQHTLWARSGAHPRPQNNSSC